MPKISYVYVDYESWHPDRILREYIVQSCCLYMFRCPLLTEWAYERLAKVLLQRWRGVTSDLKSLVDVHSLRKSCSGYYLCYDETIVDEALDKIRKSDNEVTEEYEQPERQIGFFGLE